MSSLRSLGTSSIGTTTRSGENTIQESIGFPSQEAHEHDENDDAAEYGEHVVLDDAGLQPAGAAAEPLDAAPDGVDRPVDEPAVDGAADPGGGAGQEPHAVHDTVDDVGVEGGQKA